MQGRGHGRFGRLAPRASRPETSRGRWLKPSRLRCLAGYTDPRVRGSNSAANSTKGRPSAARNLYMISSNSGYGFADISRSKTTAQCRYVEAEVSGSRQVDPTYRPNWTENVGSLCHGEGGGGAPEGPGRGLRGAEAAKVRRRCYRVETVLT